MNRVLWILLGAAILLVSLVVGGFLLLFEPYDYTEPAGPTGIARVNPYRAAELFGDAMGVPSESAWGVTNLPDSDGMIVVATESPAQRGAIAADLYTWVDTGGELIIPLMHEDPLQDPLLEYFYLVPDRPVPFDESAGRIAGWDMTIAPQQLFALGPDNECLALDEAGVSQRDQCVGAWFQVGNGNVLILSDLRIFSNDQIADHQHARFLAALLGDESGRASHVTWILDSGEASMWSVFSDRFPLLPWSALAFMLVTFIAHRRRFGPEIPSADRAVRRNIVEHVEGTGRLLWRFQERKALVQPMRRAVIRRATRGFTGASDAERLERAVTVISERLEEDSERVRSLLQAPILTKQKHATFDTITALHRYWRCL